MDGLEIQTSGCKKGNGMKFDTDGRETKHVKNYITGSSLGSVWHVLKRLKRL